jgi:hypothetical protein
MTPRIVRRAATAAASATVAVVGLLALGGTASATELPHSEHSVLTPASHSHGGDRCAGDERLGSHDGDGPDRVSPGDGAGRHHRVQHGDRDSYRVRVDEARRVWVLDQIQWLRSHDLLY